MTSSPSSALPIFCDWLDVTFSPTDCPYPELNLLLLGAGFEVSRDAAGVRCYLPPDGARGMVQVSHKARYAKVSLSGGACAALRALRLFEQVLWVLASSPHKVTRLDAALDLPTDAADVLAALQSRYPGGVVNLGRKGLPVTRMLATRGDGRESGTYYVGHRTAARFTARVYDKALEADSKRGELLPPTTRFEVTARKDSGATLRDAGVPSAIFWHIAAPALLNRPEGVPMWVPDLEAAWSAPPRLYQPAEVLQRRVEASPELDALLELADTLGPQGRRHLLHLLARRIDPDAATASAQTA